MFMPPAPSRQRRFGIGSVEGVVNKSSDGVYGDARSDLAIAVATHSVGDQKEPPLAVEPDEGGRHVRETLACKAAT